MAEAEKRAEYAQQRAEEAERRVEEAERRAGEAEERAAAAESEAAQAATGSKRRRSGRAKTAARPRATRKAASGEAVDLNAAGFEDLRGLGLSVAESARVIALRDLRSGFESLKELDELPDLSREAVTRLKRRVTV